MATETGNVPNPPYLGYGTFKNYCGDLAATTIPPRIDATVMEGKSGGTKAALRVALTFFGLTRQDGTVTETLRTLVGNHGTDRWSEHLRLLIEDRYASIVNGVPLTHGTAGQLATAFRENTTLGSGTTRSKAIGFYLQAAKDAGIELSPHFRTPKSASSSNVRKRTKVEKNVGGGSGGGSDDPRDDGNLDLPDGWVVQPFNLPDRKEPIQIVMPTDLKAREWKMISAYMVLYVETDKE